MSPNDARLDAAIADFQRTCRDCGISDADASEAIALATPKPAPRRVSVAMRRALGYSTVREDAGTYLLIQHGTAIKSGLKDAAQVDAEIVRRLP